MWTMLGMRDPNSPPTLLFIPFHVPRHWQTIWDNYFSPSLFKHVRGTNISQIYLCLWLLATLIYHIVSNIYIIIFNIFNTILFLGKNLHYPYKRKNSCLEIIVHMGGHLMHIYIPKDHVHKKMIGMNLLIGLNYYQ
jgi:hypothetical protein